MFNLQQAKVSGRFEGEWGALVRKQVIWDAIPAKEDDQFSGNCLVSSSPSTWELLLNPQQCHPPGSKELVLGLPWTGIEDGGVTF